MHKLSVKYKDQKNISVFNMQDGQIGVITKWGTSTEYLGRIIQRYNDVLVSVGNSSGKAWPFMLSQERDNKKDFTVRPLESGDCIVIE